MSELFKAKIRKIGNSLGLIVPSYVIEEMGFHQGDIIHIIIPKSKNIDRNNKLIKMAGIDRDKRKFNREKMDRF